MNVERFRERLLDERRRVTDAIEYLSGEQEGASEDETSDVRLDDHIADNATETFDREIDHSLGANAVAVLAAIDRALARIDEGTFGVCARCGQPIGEERLEAVPYATLCIDCKRLEERS